MALRKALLSLALLAAVGLLGFKPIQDKEEEGFVALFNGKDLSGFKWTLQGDKENDDTFTIEDGILSFGGKPYGYLYTEKSYKNYSVRFDWKFVKESIGGAMVHVTGPHRVWPKCIVLHGGYENYGHLFPLGGAKCKFNTDKEAQKKAIKRGEWNTTEIISKDGQLTTKVNGIQICTGEVELTEGPIAWQSEGGGPILFKNIRIKEMP